MKPDPASSPCPVWTGNGNVVSCCRSSSGRPLSADCGGRIAPGASSSDVSSLLQSSAHSLVEQLCAEPSTAFRNQKIQWNMQNCLISLYTLRMHEPYILCEGINGLLELFGKLKIVDHLLVLPYSFLQHYHTSVILKQAPFPKMQHIKWRAITSWSSLSLSPSSASHCSFPVSAARKHTWTGLKHIRCSMNKAKQPIPSKYCSCCFCLNNRIKAPSFSQCYGSCAWGRWGRPQCIYRSRSRWSRWG